MNKTISSAAIVLAFASGCSEKPSDSGKGAPTAGAAANSGGTSATPSQGGFSQGGFSQGGSSQGGSSQGGSSQGGSSQGGSSQGGSSQGGSSQGGSSQGGSSQGGSSQGGSSQGGSSQGGTSGTTGIPAGLPAVEGQSVSPPATPVSVADGSVQVCKTGDNWVTLVSKNNIGCAKACQSRGMNCRRSYHDVAGACEAQPYELGCGQLAEQSTDFCACSSETFFQGKLYTEHPRTRVAPPLETCQAGAGWATIVFHDKSGCIAACQSVGLKCHAAYEDLELECGPQADPAFKLDCNNTLGHASDFCVCTVDGSAAGLPASVVTPWKPF